ncbi:hypothetical protein C8F04DRAFT_1193573 [Mycena alexandri]|uniref:Uncharacterized protein n=1 Tax=Mycena alexandri TaxID=1745969 RepID=A0AAD6SD32_9AGAR|nr:hypothetical protein C8F04DRAFT_1193573 [Mycena alexandri]
MYFKFLSSTDVLEISYRIVDEIDRRTYSVTRHGPSIAPDLLIHAFTFIDQTVLLESGDPCRQLKKEEQRIKTRHRMARLRERLKASTLEEQEAAKERARLARARYRDSHRSELREHARDMRAKQFAAEHGVEAYKAKLEMSRQKQLKSSMRTRRAVRPKVPKGQGQKARQKAVGEDLE